MRLNDCVTWCFVFSWFKYIRCLSDVAETVTTVLQECQFCYYLSSCRPIMSAENENGCFVAHLIESLPISMILSALRGGERYTNIYYTTTMSIIYACVTRTSAGKDGIISLEYNTQALTTENKKWNAIPRRSGGGVSDRRMESEIQKPWEVLFCCYCRARTVVIKNSLHLLC